MEAVQGDSDAMLERIALVEDMRTEWEQTEVLRSLLLQAPSLSLVELDEVIRVCVSPSFRSLDTKYKTDYAEARVFCSGPSACDVSLLVFLSLDLQLFAIDRLESYLHEEGPVAPILITSQPGCGKSTLMAYW